VISPLEELGPAVQVQGPLLLEPQVPLAVLQVWLPPHAPQLAPPEPQRVFVSLA
jgi:hypothetical protein